jgi:hypothetical protein
MKFWANLQTTKDKGIKIKKLKKKKRNLKRRGLSGLKKQEDNVQ